MDFNLKLEIRKRRNAGVSWCAIVQHLRRDHDRHLEQHDTARTRYDVDRSPTRQPDPPVPALTVVAADPAPTVGL